MAAMRRAGRARGPVMALVLGAVLVLGAAAGSLPDICRLPKVVGRCRAAFPRWWYNTTSQACQLFTFGGCKGNSNNFLTEEKCFQKCTTDGDKEATETPGWLSTKEYCAKPQDVGPCRASFPRWYFDMESQTCKKFIYGGCGGNENNHVSEGQCLKQCSGAGDSIEEPAEFHPHLFSDPLIHSTRAVVLAVLLAIMAAILLGSMVVFFVKICRKNQPLSLGTVWNTLDDKEYLMSNAYTL